MSKGQRIFLALLIAALCAGVAYLATRLEWEKVTKHTGMSGEALRNPYHAATELMRHLGYGGVRLTDVSQLKTLPTEASLLLGNPERFSDAAQRERLLSWVRRGGHLFLPLNPQMHDSAWLDALGIQLYGPLRTSKPALPVEIEGQRLNADLDGIEVFGVTDHAHWQATLDGWQIDEAEDEGEDTANSTPPSTKHQNVPATDTAHFVIEPPEGQENEAPTDTVSVYARFPVGEGFVTVGGIELFDNHQIPHFDQASLFVRLLSLPGGARPVYVILAPEYPSLAGWLMQHAPYALLALAVLLLAGAWHFAPRFGPRQPDPARARPGLREHLSACGAFMLRTRSHEALIAPLREDVENRLTQLHNRYPDIDSLAELAEKISGIPPSEIKRALLPAPPNHQEFLRRCHTLALLRTHCNRLSRATSVSGLPL